MTELSTNEASKPNPLIATLSPLIGVWDTIGTHPMVPGKTFHGRQSFAWLEGGAFMIMHSRMDEPEMPSGIAIFGSDDTTQDISMLYFDERLVSRRYETSLQNNVWKWWRTTEKFSQRFTGMISSDGRTITSTGEMSRDGKPWEPDLQLTYTRVQEK